MIKFVEHKKIDKKKWDDCIDQSYNQSASGYSWYLDIVCKNWSAIILNDYEVVFPLPIKSKYAIKYLLQPLFIRCLSIYGEKTLSTELVNLFFNAIPVNIRLIDIHLKENIPFERNDFSIVKRNVQLLDLNQPIQIIRESYNRSALKNIRKATKSNLLITDNISPEKIVETYQENIGNQVKMLNSGHYTTISKLMSAALQHKHGITIGVTNAKKEIIASAFFMTTKSTIYFSFGSANAEGKSIGAMYLMMDEIIDRYSRKFKTLDFEGSDMEGIAGFNRNFGGKDFLYLQIKKNTLPDIVKRIAGKKAR